MEGGQGNGLQIEWPQDGDEPNPPSTFSNSGKYRSALSSTGRLGISSSPLNLSCSSCSQKVASTPSSCLLPSSLSALQTKTSLCPLSHSSSLPWCLLILFFFFSPFLVPRPLEGAILIYYTGRLLCAKLRCLCAACA